jgi:hypothetical protein
MSYAIQPYVVDFQEIARSRGAQDARLATRAIQVARRLHRRSSAVSEAVRAWVEGTRSAKDVSAQGYALEVLAAVLGEQLPNDAWSSMRSDWFDQVDEALKRALSAGKKARPPRLSAFFHAGPPRGVRGPSPADFPLIGHIPPREIVRLRKALDGALSAAQASHGEAPRSILETSSSWHIFQKPRGSDETVMLIWNDRLVRVSDERLGGKKKVHRSREAAYKDARTRILRWLRAGYRWNNLALVDKKRYRQALRELESKLPIPQRAVMSREAAASIEQFVLWLDTAASRRQGLLFFYY